MTKVIVREYQPEDRAVVERCILELHEDEYNRRPHFWVAPMKEVASQLMEHLVIKYEKEREGKMLVGLIDDKPVGWIAVKAVTTEGPEVAVGKYGYINELAVLRQYQGQGVGRALMDKAEEFIRSLDLEWIGLNTHPDNPAREFYNNRDYKEVSIRMEKKLK